MLTGQPQVKVKTMKPPAKVQIPQGEEPEEEPEEEPQRAGGGDGGGGGGACGAAQGLTRSSPPVQCRPLPLPLPL